MREPDRKDEDLPTWIDRLFIAVAILFVIAFWAGAAWLGYLMFGTGP